MKKEKKYLTVILLMCFLLFCATTVYASSFLNEILSEGNSFADRGSDSGLGSTISSFISGDIMSIVSIVGNLVFAAVTVILGAKYIWSGVDGRSQVKETLPSFIAAVLFFYLAIEITGLFSPKTDGSIGESIAGATNYTNLTSMIIGTVNMVVKYLAFGGIVFIGLKYMFESAEGKAQIKDRLVPMVLGIVLVFTASTVVDFIIAVGQQTLM